MVVLKSKSKLKSIRCRKRSVPVSRRFIKILKKLDKLPYIPRMSVKWLRSFKKHRIAIYINCLMRVGRCFFLPMLFFYRGIKKDSLIKVGNSMKVKLMYLKWFLFSLYAKGLKCVERSVIHALYIFFTFLFRDIFPVNIITVDIRNYSMLLERLFNCNNINFVACRFSLPVRYLLSTYTRCRIRCRVVHFGLESFYGCKKLLSSTRLSSSWVVRMTIVVASLLPKETLSKDSFDIYSYIYPKLDVYYLKRMFYDLSYYSLTLKEKSLFVKLLLYSLKDHVLDLLGVADNLRLVCRYLWCNLYVILKMYKLLSPRIVMFIKFYLNMGIFVNYSKSFNKANGLLLLMVRYVILRERIFLYSGGGVCLDKYVS